MNIITLCILFWIRSRSEDGIQNEWCRTLEDYAVIRLLIIKHLVLEDDAILWQRTPCAMEYMQLTADFT